MTISWTYLHSDYINIRRYAGAVDGFVLHAVGRLILRPASAGAKGRYVPTWFVRARQACASKRSISCAAGRCATRAEAAAIAVRGLHAALGPR